MGILISDESIYISIDRCNNMEEHKFKHSRTTSHNLLSLISSDKLNFPSRTVNLHIKDKQSLLAFNKRPSQRLEPSRKVTELGPLKYMTKHTNKVQKNILRHKLSQMRRITLKKIKCQKQQQPIKIKVYCHQAYFTPKARKEIFQKYNQGSCQKQNEVEKQLLKPQRSSLNISRLHGDAQVGKRNLKMMKKSRLGSSHSAMTNSSEWAGLLNQIKNKISESSNQDVTQYNRQQLQGYYLALLKFSKGDARKYKQGFQTMLSLMDVTANEKVLTEWFNHFKANPTLEQFILAFNNIVDALLRQKVMDFFEIVFQDCKKIELTRLELINHLSQRLNRREADEIVDQLQQNLKWDPSRPISTASILALCCTNDDFCWFMRQFNILELKK